MLMLMKEKEEKRKWLQIAFDAHIMCQKNGSDFFQRFNLISKTNILLESISNRSETLYITSKLTIVVCRSERHALPFSCFLVAER